MMVYPTAVRTFADGDEYTSVIAKVSMGIIFFDTPYNLMMDGIFDLTQNYFWIFVLVTVLQGACVLLILRGFPKEKVQTD